MVYQVVAAIILLPVFALSLIILVLGIAGVGELMLGTLRDARKKYKEK
jgi:hypothetical protein